MMRLHVLSFVVAVGGFIAAGAYIYKNRADLIFADDENNSSISLGASRLETNIDGTPLAVSAYGSND
jgi:hypothetical protein